MKKCVITAIAIALVVALIIQVACSKPAQFELSALDISPAEVASGEEFLPTFVKEFSTKILSINLRRPSLEDVFLKLTGRAIRQEEVSDIFKAMVRQHGRRIRH